MARKVLAINMKAYAQASGKKALKIAKDAEKIKSKTEIIIIPQITDLKEISKNTKLKVFAQHVDLDEAGAHTGHITIEQIKLAGATGTLLNHSEKRLDKKAIKKTIARCKELGLKTMVCAQTTKEVAEIVKMKPDYVAIEPPELIGGDISVSSAKPEIISNSFNKTKNTSVELICGAGVKTNEDIKKAFALGAQGVLIASGVAKAKNPGIKIKELLKDL